MSVAIQRSTIMKAVQDLPEETSIEAAIEKLYLISKIKKGINQADAGQTLSHTEVKNRLDKWLK
jgi:predicted transcriptional regulator